MVVAPAKSLLANLTPFASPDWYWKEPDAGDARPRRCEGPRAGWRAALWAPRQAVDRENMVKRTPSYGAAIDAWGGGNGWDGQDKGVR